MIGSVFRTGKNYSHEIFLEECKYIVKERKIAKYIDDDVKTSSHEENFDNENFDKENSNEEI